MDINDARMLERLLGEFAWEKEADSDKVFEVKMMVEDLISNLECE